MHCNIKIKGNLVSLPFSDQDLAYDKQAVQRAYGLGIVKEMKIMNLCRKVLQRVENRQHLLIEC